RAAVEITDVRAIGTLRIDVGVVGTVARVERGVPRQRRRGVAVARAGEPPASDFPGPRDGAHVDDPVELVVARVARREVRGAGGDVDVFAVHPPEMMD